MKGNQNKVIFNLYQEGYKLREIALLTNISIFKIYKCLRQNNA